MAFLNSLMDLRKPAVLACVLALAGCGGGGGEKYVALPLTGVALYTTATGPITMERGSSLSYTVGGGGAGASITSYSASSNNPAVATGTIAGSKLTIQALAAGSVNISVMDSSGSGQIVTIPVTVTVADTPTVPAREFYTTAQSAVTIQAGQRPSYQVGGGTGPYLVTTSNAGVALASIVDNKLTITALTSGSAAIVASDATGAKLNIAVTVPGQTTGTALYTTAQSAITVAAGSSTTFVTAGGTGPYVATSDDTAIATASMAGHILTIGAVKLGNATIRVSDAANASTTISVKVGASSMLYTTAPTSVTILPGASPSYTILGGVAPYVATSSAAAYASVTLDGNVMTITGKVPGEASILVLDSAGSAVTIAVSVPTP